MSDHHGGPDVSAFALEQNRKRAAKTADGYVERTWKCVRYQHWHRFTVWEDGECRIENEIPEPAWVGESPCYSLYCSQESNHKGKHDKLLNDTRIRATRGTRPATPADMRAETRITWGKG